MMDISLATRKTPKKTQAEVEKPRLRPYHGTSTAAARNVNENRRVFVQIRGARVAAVDEELGAEGLGGMAVVGSTGWPVKLPKHSTDLGPTERAYPRAPEFPRGRVSEGAMDG